VNTLIDVVLDLLDSARSASSERGLVGTMTAASVLSAVATLWLLLTRPSPLAHLWGLGAVLGTVVVGGAAVFTCVLHFSRNESDRVFAAVCLLCGAGSLGIVIFGVVSR
jgi:hypothetical protein